MTPPLKSAGPWVMIAALGLLAGAAAVADRGPALALVNESPSLPRGVYLRRPGAEPGRGAVVAIPQPTGARPYLAALGMPADVRLIKRVAAVGGDEVCAGNGVVRTPAGRVRALTRDRRGAPLAAWTGCRRLAEGELFLLGDTAGSFDSRYFGPVARSRVDGVYREILTW